MNYFVSLTIILFILQRALSYLTEDSTEEEENGMPIIKAAITLKISPATSSPKDQLKFSWLVSEVFPTNTATSIKMNDTEKIKKHVYKTRTTLYYDGIKVLFLVNSNELHFVLIACKKKGKIQREFTNLEVSTRPSTAFENHSL